jgi:hypothetical protein
MLKSHIELIVSITLILLLSACAAPGTIDQSVGMAEVTDPTSEPVVLEQPDNQTGSTQTAVPVLPAETQSHTETPVVVNEGEETSLPELATPAVRLDLEATDPTGVRLDSGKVQLVEFFAFW